MPGWLPDSSGGGGSVRWSASSESVAKLTGYLLRLGGCHLILDHGGKHSIALVNVVLMCVCRACFENYALCPGPVHNQLESSPVKVGEDPRGQFA